jgi:hypothetical protein
MNKEKTLIITGTTDIFRKKEETDNTMQEVFELTLPSKQRYAKKHGYDLLSLNSFGEDKNKIFGSKNIGFLRVVRCFEMLEHYDAIMWVDADAIITNYDYKIQDFIQEDPTLIVSWDWSGKRTFSTGNFILRNTEKTKQLFNVFLQVGDFVIKNNEWGEEQTTFNLIYNSTELQNTISVLDHKFLNSIPTREMFIGKWGSRPIPYPWSKESFLSHITGISNEHRIEILINSFSEYL